MALASCLALFFSFAPATAAVGAGTVKEYELPDRGHFAMWVPRAWLDEVDQPEALPPTIRLRPAEGAPFLVLVTPIWTPDAAVPAPDKASLQARVARGAAALRDKAAETEIKVWEFAGANGPGFYFSLTDRSNAGEYRFVTQGLLRVNQLVVAFTILNNRSKDALLPEAMKMLQSAVHREN